MNLTKVAEHKVSTQKSVAFLYTNSEQSEKEISESSLICRRIKQNEILGN